MKEWHKLLLLVGTFVLLYTAPLDAPAVSASLTAGLRLLTEYARQHVLTCLVPAFFIAGTIAVYVKKDSVLRLLGPTAKPYVSYPVASLSGGILAVCSCTILPLFAGIYRRGAGIGPAVAFLFTGPAINVTAIMLTGTVLGWDLAAGRLIAAAVISIGAGLLMAAMFGEHDRKNSSEEFITGLGNDVPYSNATIGLFLGLQLATLIVLSTSLDPGWKISLVVLAIAAIAAIALRLFGKEHTRQWMSETWNLAKKILPYLLVGVFLAGILEIVVPPAFVSALVGGNSIPANLVASLFGAFMYFATLTEVPIVEKLIALGMGRGPSLTLLLTGNTLSLPSMIVLYSLMGSRKATVYICAVVVMSALAGAAFGALMP